MAISKQNRVIGVVAVIFLSVTGISFYKYKKSFVEGAYPILGGSSTEKSDLSEESEPNLNSVDPGSELQNLRDEKIKNANKQVFSQIAGDLSECMSLKFLLSSKEQSDLDALLEGLSTSLGEPMSQADRWNSWRVKTEDGRNREYRLEVIESDGGQVTRELHAYAFDQSGEQIPMELDPFKSQNPSEDYLKEILNSGEVTSKNRAGSISFPSGETLDFTEINGELGEIEFTKMNQIFKCNTIKERETCQCLN